MDSSVKVKWLTMEEGSVSALEILDSFTDASFYLGIRVDLLIGSKCPMVQTLASPVKKLGVVYLIYYNLLKVRKLDETVLEESAIIAFDGRVTFYDTVPAGVAMIEKIQCITADRKTQLLPLSRQEYPITLLE